MNTADNEIRRMGILQKCTSLFDDYILMNANVGLAVLIVSLMMIVYYQLIRKD